MVHTQITCPDLGHRAFQKELPAITIGEVDSRAQVSKYIRPYTCVEDDLNIQYPLGELQKHDLLKALSMFEFPKFIDRVFVANLSLFRYSQCRIYQFQTNPKSGQPFVFGMFITDGSHNLIDYCIQSPHVEKRKAVLLRLIRAICTSESTLLKLNH